MRALRPPPQLALSLLVAVAYLTGLRGPFQFDDLDVIVRYEPVHSLAGWWAALGHGIRPLLKLTYAVNWALDGVLGFHLFNLIVHVANTNLVLRLYSAATDPGRRWPFRDWSHGAFAAAALFAIHPVQTEAVTYISGRSSSLVTFFALSALLAYADASRASKPWIGMSLALLSFVCALLVKESAATLPFGLLIWDLAVERTRVRRALAKQIPFIGVPLALLAWAILKPNYYALLYRTLGARPLLDAFIQQIDGVGYLLSRLVLVHRLSIDPGLGLRAPAAPVVAGVSGFLLFAFGFALCVARTRPVVTFGISWFLLNVFLPYVFATRVDVINERHMYLASVGGFMAFGALWAELSSRFGKPTIWRAAGAWGLVVLSAATARRNWDYRSPIALWESTVHVSPANPRAHNNLGTAYETSGRLDEARREYVHALALEPEYASARRNLERVAGRAGLGER